MISAIIPLYHPDELSLKTLLCALETQVDRVYLVDNASASLSLTSFPDFVEYVPLKTNLGLAEAQNIGIRLALAADSDWLVFFDQDSHVTEGFVQSLASSFEALEQQGYRPALVGPVVKDKDSGDTYARYTRLMKQAKPVMSQCYELDETQSSGSLISANVLSKVGEMRSDWFIDSIDHEWCFRAKGLGFRNYITGDVVLAHKIGARKQKIFGREVNVGAPFRHYYVFRNWLLLYRLPYVPLKWKLKNMALMPIKILLFTTLLDNRISRLKFIYRGLKDGLLGKTGIFPN